MRSSMQNLQNYIGNVERLTSGANRNCFSNFIRQPNSKDWLKIETFLWEQNKQEMSFVAHQQVNIISCMHAKLLQLCPVLCDPTDYSPLGSLSMGFPRQEYWKRVAMPTPRGSSWPRDWTQVSCTSCTAGDFFTTELPGKPKYVNNNKSQRLSSLNNLKVLLEVEISWVWGKTFLQGWALALELEVISSEKFISWRIKCLVPDIRVTQNITISIFGIHCTNLSKGCMCQLTVFSQHGEEAGYSVMVCTTSSVAVFTLTSPSGQGIIYGSASAKSHQSCLILCDPRDSSLPGSPVTGILQARTLEWVAFSNAWKWKVKVKLLSRIQLSDPMDWSLPGSSIHGIFQARVLEWVAIAFSVHYCYFTFNTLKTLRNHYNFLASKFKVFKIQA